MVSEIMNGYGANLVVAIVAVAVALLLLFFASRILRNRGIVGRMPHGSGPRLAVLDSTAVDANRRLVLVRRDDVEHLILIGGPSDLVIESGIGRKKEAPAPILSAPEPEPRVPAAPAPSAPASQRKEAAPASTAPARMPAKEPAVEEVAVRRPVDRAPASKPADAIRTAEPSTENPAAWPAPNRGPVEGVRRNIEEVLDHARGRVFGPVPAHETAAIQPPRSAAPIRANAEPKAAARFEDFLDAEIAGDLSSVTPGEATATSDALPSERVKREPSPDSDMARLLSELSPKR